MVNFAVSYPKYVQFYISADCCAIKPSSIADIDWRTNCWFAGESWANLVSSADKGDLLEEYLNLAGESSLGVTFNISAIVRKDSIEQLDCALSIRETVLYEISTAAASSF